MSANEEVDDATAGIDFMTEEEWLRLMHERRTAHRAVMRLRELSYLSIPDVSERSGIERWRIARIEDGAIPSEQEVRSLATAMGVEADKILAWYGPHLLACYECESRDVKAVRRTRTWVIGAREVPVSKVESHECSACGASWFDMDTIHAAELRAALLVLLGMQGICGADPKEVERIMLGEVRYEPLDDEDIHDIRCILGMTAEEMRAEFGFEPTTSTDEERKRARDTLLSYVIAARYHRHLPNDLDAVFDAVLEDKAPVETAAKKWAAVQYARPVDAVGAARESAIKNAELLERLAKPSRDEELRAAFDGVPDDFIGGEDITPDDED